MDKITKQILREIKHAKNQTIISSGIDSPFSDIASEPIVNASIDYLVKNGYIYVEEELTTKISVGYRVLHPFQYYSKILFSYLFQNWIAIAALIISLIALIKQ